MALQEVRVKDVLFLPLAIFCYLFLLSCCYIETSLMARLISSHLSGAKCGYHFIKQNNN